ncbi:unnamed protein product [Phaeothamnion confervicola]
MSTSVLSFAVMVSVASAMLASRGGWVALLQSRPSCHIFLIERAKKHHRGRVPLRCSAAPERRLGRAAEPPTQQEAQVEDAVNTAPSTTPLTLLRFHRELDEDDPDTRRARLNAATTSPPVYVLSAEEVVTLLVPAASVPLAEPQEVALAWLLPYGEGWCLEAASHAAPERGKVLTGSAVPYKRLVNGVSQGRGDASAVNAVAPSTVLEFGPRLHTTSPWGSNVMSVLRSCGFGAALRAERSRRYRFSLENDSVGVNAPVPSTVAAALGAALHDPMTEELYPPADDGTALLVSFSRGTAPTAVIAPSNGVSDGADESPAALPQLQPQPPQASAAEPFPRFGDCLARRGPPPARIPLGREGAAALRRFSARHGLGWGDWDVAFYADLFGRLGRDPTEEELFDVGQSNSEHCRHWFFRGQLVVDGIPRPLSLLDTVKGTLATQQEQQRRAAASAVATAAMSAGGVVAALLATIEDGGATTNGAVTTSVLADAAAAAAPQSLGNSVLAFCDNSSGIRGSVVPVLRPAAAAAAASYDTGCVQRHIITTAETHNFPCGVAPFPGAATGVGGRLRDIHATGRGAVALAGIAGYSVGEVQLPGGQPVAERRSAASATGGDAATEENPTDRQRRGGYDTSEYPAQLATPLEVLLHASDGASDYANKYGEPLVAGFARSCRYDAAAIIAAAAAADGSNCADGVAASGDDVTGAAAAAPWRVEWLKPIMFSAGVGAVDAEQVEKLPPEPGMLLVKIGGPAYRVGLGGGSASSRGAAGLPTKEGNGRGNADRSKCSQASVRPPTVGAAAAAAAAAAVEGRGKHAGDGAAVDTVPAAKLAATATTTAAATAAAAAASLDLRAVQRGDAEVGNKVGRVVRALSELGGAGNPVLSLHDQGAGGNANVLKELAAPAGAVVLADAFHVGDARLTALELWASEYQESHALLCSEAGAEVVAAVCAREGVPAAAVGRVTGDGRIVLLERIAGAEAADADAEADAAVVLDLWQGRAPGLPFLAAATTAATPLSPLTAAAIGAPAMGMQQPPASLLKRVLLSEEAASRSIGGKCVGVGVGWRRAVDLPLDAVLRDVPQRVYYLKSDDASAAAAGAGAAAIVRESASLSAEPLRRRPPARGEARLVALLRADRLSDAPRLLRGVLALVSVGSKKFLTSKVDRSVGGLVARQPCCGPFQLPVADVGVTALGHFGHSGAAVAVGECPPVALLDPAAMARMAVGEALTNLVFAPWEGGGDVAGSLRAGSSSCGWWGQPGRQTGGALLRGAGNRSGSFGGRRPL